QTAVTQPALFTVEYALAQLWLAWGVKPQAMLGHSIGEYVAACLAGVFTLEDALALVAARGRLVQELPEGAMLAVPLPAAELAPLLDDRVGLAAINGPALCAVAGPAEAVDPLEERLRERGVECRRLVTSHAFHSPMLDPILDRFADLVRKTALKPPVLPYLSNVTGTWITPEQATDPAYWVRHLRGTVRFADGALELLRSPNLVLLEVGPGATLGALVRQHTEQVRGHAVISTLRQARETGSDSEYLATALGRLWAEGVPVDWQAYWQGEQRRRVSLPAYPFERKRCWIDPPTTKAVATTEVDQPEADPTEERTTPYVAPRTPLEEHVASVWQTLLGVERVGIHDSFFELGGHSLLATQVASRLRETFPVDLPLQRLLDDPTVARTAAIIEELLVAKLEQLDDDEVKDLAHNMEG
ncbi:MAG TPA: acyltransferase domain-containing protein, partial [Symbiobacteriaceae bacterium]|nr:acyltransferase domain-containing protein [Symbiobacteriaceae bacterium]